MYNTLKESYMQVGNRPDPDYPERALRIDLLTRVLKGTIYNHLKYPFHEEVSGPTSNPDYIPLRQRRPSVRYNISKIVVDDSVSLLFGEEHFPKISCDDEKTKLSLEDFIRETVLNLTMIEAATTGSVGSVVILFKIVRGSVYFEVKSTQFLTPVYDLDNPGELVMLREMRKMKGVELAALGFSIPNPSDTYWFLREWDQYGEWIYAPYTTEQAKKEGFTPQRDALKSRPHGLGFLPAVWIKNLPNGDDIDGQCTFEEAIDTNIELDYQLSQAGRGLKYSSDPKLVINSKNGGFTPLTDPAANALVVDGDAKLLEINGNAAKSVLEYAESLRKFALESIHGNRTDTDRISALQSGKAMELMNQALIWLVEKLRITYGNCGLLVLLRMIIKANQLYPLNLNDRVIAKGELNSKAKITLNWPAWYPPTAADRVQLANGLKAFRDAGNLSRESAVKSIASVFDIENLKEEINLIKQDEKEFVELNKPKATEVKQI